jgi:acid phosphatase
VPAPAHTVVVVMENHSYAGIIGNPAAPFINALARRGALFTRSYAVTHPSQPNYLALFSGSTQGVTGDGCPQEFTAPNLAADLIKAGRSFAGYAEDLPGTGSPVCVAGDYARKHVPWTDFANVPASVSLPFTSFPADFARLPAVSFVIPGLCHDMHDCSVAAGDAWLRDRIGGYADWAMTHHSLLVLTWDEDDDSTGNHIVTIFAGQPVRPGRYAEPVTHYAVLATIEAAYSLPRDGQAAAARPVTGIWAR